MEHSPTRWIGLAVALGLFGCGADSKPNDEGDLDPDSGSVGPDDERDAGTEDAGTDEDDADAPSARPDAASASDAGRADASPPASVDAGTTPVAAGSWSSGKPMPTTRTELAVAELDGKIYVAGGFGGLPAFEVYNPAADTWEQLADLPTGREHPSLAALGGLVYMTGGNASETFAYDPKTDAWTPRKALLYQRYAAAAVALDGAIYLIGGTGPSARVVQRYDPAADTWTARAELSMIRDHVAAVALNGKIYALGGRPGVGAVYPSVEIYDPVQNRFEPGPAMLEGRSGFGAGVVEGKIYAAGGEVLVQPYSVRDTAEVFDPATGKWSFKAKLPMPLHGTGGVGLGARFYLFGGATMPASATVRAGGVNILSP